MFILFLFFPERAGHAADMMLDLKRTDYYGIVVVSGDGLIFEVGHLDIKQANKTQYNLCERYKDLGLFPIQIIEMFPYNQN